MKRVISSGQVAVVCNYFSSYIDLGWCETQSRYHYQSEMKLFHSTFFLNPIADKPEYIRNVI